MIIQHTIKEAKNKCCPIQSHPSANGMCEADKCMLWQRMNKKSGEGYCGMNKGGIVE